MPYICTVLGYNGPPPQTLYLLKIRDVSLCGLPSKQNAFIDSVQNFIQNYRLYNIFLSIVL